MRAVTGAAIIYLLLAISLIALFTPPLKASVIQGSESRSIGRPAKIAVRAGITNIDVRYWSGNEVKLRLEWFSLLPGVKPSINCSVGGGEAEVEVAEPSVGGIIPVLLDVELEILVPRQLGLEALDIRTSSGNIGVEVDSGSLKASASSGSVRITATYIEEVSISTSSGNIIVKAGFRSLSIVASSGNVDVIIREGFRGDAVIQTSSGNVYIAVEGVVNAILTVDTSSGTVNMAGISGAMILESGPHRLVAKLGDGDGKINIITSSGNVYIHS